DVAARLAKAVCYQATGYAAFDGRYIVTFDVAPSIQNCEIVAGSLLGLTIIDTSLTQGAQTCGFKVTKAANEIGLHFSEAGNGGSCQYEGVQTTNNGTTQQV